MNAHVKGMSFSDPHDYWSNWHGSIGETHRVLGLVLRKLVVDTDGAGLRSGKFSREERREGLFLRGELQTK